MSSANTEADAGPRRYRSTRRARQAEQTRTDVLLAAMRLFASNGWAGTTLGSVAGEAEVAIETIYSSFRSKKLLLRAAMEVAIAGDADLVPVLQRAEITQLWRLPIEQRIRGGARWVAGLYSGPVVGVWFAMLEAAANDPEVAAWCGEHEQRRHDTIAKFLELLFEQPPSEPQVDHVWALISLELYAKLTRQRGWTQQQYEDWVVETITRVRP